MSNNDNLVEEANRISRELAELREEIKRLKEKKLEAQRDLVELRNERTKLLSVVRSLKEQLRVVREERRKLIEEYKKLSAERKEEVDQLRALRELISMRTTEIQGLEKEIKIPISAIKQKIEEIEWTIQTHVLSPEQENDLIRRLRAYNKLLNKALAIQERREEVLELRATYLSSKTRLKELTIKLSELRKIIDEKTSKINELREKLEHALKEYLSIKEEISQRKKQLEEYNKEITEKTARSIALREQYQKILAEIERARAQEVLDKKKREVEKSIEQRAKKRLTIDELKIIYGDLEDLESS